jgi:ubiquinone/menaquinone biosynthesis C-methylase UbiE
LRSSTPSYTKLQGENAALQQKPTSAVNGRLWGSAAADWAKIQEPTCRPVYTAVFDRLQLKTGLNYLDVGCGAGLALQIAAESGARVSGLDAAENLLAIARDRVPKGDFHLGELESLPFSDDSFHLVTGFNAFQYAANPALALAEAKRVAQPGSHVVVVTWGNPQGMEAASLIAALRPLLPATTGPGPFALSGEAALRAFASAAALEALDVFDVESPWHYVDLSSALKGLRSSGVAARAIENSSVEAVDEAHAKALLPFHQPDGSYRVGATFRCLVTRA